MRVKMEFLGPKTNLGLMSNLYLQPGREGSFLRLGGCPFTPSSLTLQSLYSGMS